MFRRFIKGTAIAAACCWGSLGVFVGVSAIIQSESNEDEKKLYEQAVNRNSFFRQAVAMDDIDVSTGYGRLVRDVLPYFIDQSGQLPKPLIDKTFPEKHYEGVGDELGMDITDDVSPFNTTKRFNRDLLRQIVEARSGMRLPLEEPTRQPDLSLHFTPGDISMPNFLLIFFAGSTGLSAITVYAMQTDERRRRRAERRRLAANPVCRQLEEARRDEADLEVLLKRLGDSDDREVLAARRTLQKELQHTRQVILELSELPTNLTAVQAKLLAEQINRRNLDRLDLPKSFIDASREAGELGRA